jgi:hypothetical protein
MADLFAANPDNPWKYGVATLRDPDEMRTLAYDYLDHMTALSDADNPLGARRAAMADLRRWLNQIRPRGAETWDDVLNHVSSAMRLKPRTEAELMDAIERAHPNDPRKQLLEGMRTLSDPDEMRSFCRAFENKVRAVRGSSREQAQDAILRHVRMRVSLCDVSIGTQRTWDRVIRELDARSHRNAA